MWLWKIKARPKPPDRILRTISDLYLPKESSFNNGWDTVVQI